jgi:hypothetical protein
VKKTHAAMCKREAVVRLARFWWVLVFGILKRGATPKGLSAGAVITISATPTARFPELRQF